MFSFVLPTALFQDFLPQTHYIAVAAPVTPVAKATSIAQVPFYSQFANISSPKWQKVGCGITSLAMIINYYKPRTTTVDSLLGEAVKAGAYVPDAGWSHAGLVNASKKYGMTGSVYDLSGSNSTSALSALSASLVSGPIIASVHYKLDPQNPIPHLIVVNGIKDGVVYYNDPAAKGAQGTISTDAFMKAWKKRYITIRPVASAKVANA